MKVTWSKGIALAGLALILGSAVHANAADPGKLSATDQLLIGAQKICPVSGGKLRAMGGPLKANVGGQTVFLCCKGCFGKKISAANWSKVMANLAAAQKICPVMKRPLPKNAVSTVVAGRRVFVCCKPCTKKIAADPKKYLAIVDSQLKKNIKTRK